MGVGGNTGTVVEARGRTATHASFLGLADSCLPCFLLIFQSDGVGLLSMVHHGSHAQLYVIAVGADKAHPVMGLDVIINQIMIIGVVAADRAGTADYYPVLLVMTDGLLVVELKQTKGYSVACFSFYDLLLGSVSVRKYMAQVHNEYLQCPS